MHKTKLSLLIVLTLMCVSSAFAFNTNDILGHYNLDGTGTENNSVNPSLTPFYGNYTTQPSSSAGIINLSRGSFTSTSFLYSQQGFTGIKSISVWINQTTSSGSGGHIYGTVPWGTGASIFSLFSTGSSSVSMYAGSGMVGSSSLVNWTANQFTHIVASYNDSDASFYFYSNGKYAGKSAVTNSFSNNRQMLGINYRYTGEIYDPLNAKIDHLTIFNSTLTSTDVSQLYYSGVGCDYNCLTGGSGNFTIIASEYFTGTTLSTFNAVLENTTDIISLSTNSTVIQTNILLNSSQLFNITVSKTGYISATYTNYNISTYLQAILYKDNSLLLTFLDEINDQNVYNVTFELISDSYSNRYNTSNNQTINISGLVGGLYEIRYPIYRNNESVKYDPRSYYVYVPITDSANTNIQLRVLNETIGQLFLRNIKGSNGLPMTGYILDVQRFYVNVSPNTGTWKTVSQALIDEKGDAVFPAVANTQYYRFRILDNQTNFVYLLAKSLLVDSQSEFTVNVGGDSLSRYQTAYGITSNLYWQNSSTAFIVDYTSNNLANICLYVSYSFGTNYTNFPASCSVTSAGTLTNIVGSAQGKYCAQVVATISGSDYTIDTECIDTQIRNVKATYGVFGFILLFFALVVCAVIGMYINPIVSVLTSVMVILLFSSNYFGFVSISGTIVTSIVIVGLFLLWLWGEQN
jgi:hypothetical protein